MQIKSWFFSKLLSSVFQVAVIIEGAKTPASFGQCIAEKNPIKTE